MFSKYIIPMKYLFCILITIPIYLLLHHHYPDRFEDKYHYYFTGFILTNLVIIYLFTYETLFIYKLLNNVYYSEKPETKINLIGVDQNQLLKSQISMNQNNQCFNCHNPIFSQDLYIYKLQYIQPIQSGGNNDVNNLKLICPSCFSFQSNDRY